MKPDFPLSVSAWISIDQLVGKGGVIFRNDQWNGHSYYKGVILTYSSTGQIYVGVGNGVAAPWTRRDFLTVESLINPNEWCHIVAIYNSYDDMQIFFNGVEYATQPGNGTDVGMSYSSADGAIGSRINGDQIIQVVNGAIDDIRVYNRVLSEEEILELAGECQNSAITEVTIDIKPGSDPNSWDCKKVNEELPVVVLSTTDFDATDIDANSVRFGKTGTEASEVHEKNGEAKRHVEDKNKDGLPDMVFHFKFGETGFSCVDVPEGEKDVYLDAKLTGSTYNNEIIEGVDVLRLVKEGFGKVVAEEEILSTPYEYALLQNYPNPFNPSTIIEFDLPKTSNVTLKIYNILGEEVATLVSDRLTAESYSFVWDAGNLTSGIYLYRIVAGEY
ncbi:MAG: LamG-like jellyroll fold domain-containing protein, partial [Candidatus Kariarchaeaceae archaeon]